MVVMTMVMVVVMMMMMMMMMIMMTTTAAIAEYSTPRLPSLPQRHNRYPPLPPEYRAVAEAL